MGRLGPLSIEQKKRAAVKRAKLEKNKEDMKKPQEIREEDITRSGNETSKNVLEVCAPIPALGWCKSADARSRSSKRYWAR